MKKSHVRIYNKPISPRPLLLTGLWMSVLCITAGQSYAAENSTGTHETWAISKILERAIKVSPELQALHLDVVSAENRAKQAGRWDNPVFNVGVGPKTVGPLNGSAFQAGIQQNIPVFGQKSIESDLGRQNQRIAESDYEIRTLALRHEVVRLAYQYGAAIEQARHTQHRREGLSLIARYLGSRPFVSPSQIVEKHLIQNRLREIESLLLEVSARRETAWQSLNVFLGLSTPVTPEISWDERFTDFSKAAISEDIAKRSPEIGRQNQVVQLADLSITQAGKKAYPETALSFNYTDEKVELTERIYTFGLQFTLPIWDAGTYGKRAAEAQREAETARLDLKRLEVNARFAQAWSNYYEAKKRLALYPLSLASTLEDQFRQAETGWKKGLVPATALLELESQVHEQIFRIFTTQTEFIRAQSDLLLLAGKDFAAAAPQGGK